MTSTEKRADEFRIALVGCGRISKNHFDAIRDVDGLRLSAVCDSVTDRARAAGEEQGVPWYADYQEMLKAVSCDVVTVCSPSGLNSTQGVLAAKAGKHVITEKPMSITLEQADALIEACDRAGVNLFV